MEKKIKKLKDNADFKNATSLTSSLKVSELFKNKVSLTSWRALGSNADLYKIIYHLNK